MSKQQQVVQLFAQFDEDHDGAINADQFGKLIVELGYDYIYPGTVKKTFKKMNYQDPDKETINLTQAKEYALSFETPAKHSIWKQKYSLLEWTSEVRTDLNKESEGGIQAAAPGAPQSKPQDNSIQQANIKVLVGHHKPAYISQVNIEFQKNDNGAKVKPFVKLTLTYNSPDKAKQMQVLFKQNFNKFLKLLGEEMQQWMQEMKNFHLNSMCQGNTVTFFITTVNEQLVSLIQLTSELFELCFSSQSNGKSHLHYEFQYDFEKFITDQSSNYYDIMVRESRLLLNLRAQHFLKEFRRLFMNQNGNLMSCSDIFEQIVPIGMFHIDSVEADLQFDSYEGFNNPDNEVKQELMEGLKQVGEMLMELQEKGIEITALLQLMDADVTIEASVGEWQAKGFFRLKNINKIFLKALKDKKQNKDGSDSQKQSSMKAASLIKKNSSEVELSQKPGPSGSKKSKSKSLLKKNSSDIESQVTSKTKKQQKSYENSSESS